MSRVARFHHKNWLLNGTRGENMVLAAMYLPNPKNSSPGLKANACMMARQVPEIDLFISGHSHQRTEEPIREGDTLIVQSGQFGQALGRLRLDVDVSTGGVEVLSNHLIPTVKTPAQIRAGVRKFLSVLTVITLAIAVWLL